MKNVIQKFSKVIILVLVPATICVAYRNSSRSNFSGHWVINKDRIEFGDEPQWIYPPEMLVTQTNDSLKLIETILDENSNAKNMTESISFDGHPCISKTTSGKKITSALKFVDDNTAEVNSTVVTDDNQLWSKIKEKLYFDGDGETLMVERTVENNKGFVYTITIPYDKK